MPDTADRFVEIYETFYRDLHVYCRRRISGDRVDDVVSETFLTAWRKIERIPPGDEALPWLYGVAYRVLLHQWRGTSRRRRLEGRLTTLGVDVSTPPEEFIVSSQETRQVMEAASRLRASDREILRLSLWEELSHVDVAVVLDISAAAVRQRLSRALKNLTKEFNRSDRMRDQSPAAQKGGAQ